MKLSGRKVSVILLDSIQLRWARGMRGPESPPSFPKIDFIICLSFLQPNGLCHWQSNALQKQKSNFGGRVSIRNFVCACRVEERRKSISDKTT